MLVNQQVGVHERRLRYLSFVLIALLINVTDRVIVRSMRNPGARLLVALGASFDVIALVTASSFWSLVRPGIRARPSLAPITLIGILHATYMFPNSSGARVTLAALCEIDLIGFIVVQVMDAEGPFGARKQVHRVAIAMDEPLSLEQEIKALIETDQ